MKELSKMGSFLSGNFTGGVILQTIIYERNEGISYVYLNRPEQFNALNQEMLEALKKILAEIENNTDPIVIISGNGKAFCAGGDIKMMQQFKEKQQFDDIMEAIENIVLTLYRMPKIVITAIHGSAAGLGLSLALASDYIIANHETKLGMLFIGIGLAPDGGGHFFLEKRIGLHAAKQFIWGGKTVTAVKAKAMQLIDEVSNDDSLTAAKTMAQRLQRAPLAAMLKTKSLYHGKDADQLRNVLKTEKENQWQLRHTSDHEEGVQAFIEKRNPIFTGE